MKKANLILLTLCSFLLVGCGGSGSPSGSTSEIKKIPNIKNVYEGLTPDMEGCGEITTGGTPGGFLTEILSDRFIGEDKSYECVFESGQTDKSIRIVSSNEAHATVTMVEGSNSKFSLNTHTAGDFVLKIYDSTDCLCFRKIVRVRPNYSEEDILTVMCDAEYYHTVKGYEGFVGNWKTSFYENDNGGVNCAVKGGDDADADVQCTLSLELQEYYEPTGCYIYKTTTIETNTSQTDIGYICVSAQGDVAYTYYMLTVDGVKEDHLLNYLNNCDVDYVYNYLS